jgi:hypothetical protein
MSYGANPFSDETFRINPKVFAPLLKEDLTQADPPFTIADILTDEDFCDDRDSDGKIPYLITLNEVTRTLKAGFLNSKQELSCQQWLCSISQLLTATLQGLSLFQPRDDFPSMISHLGPEEKTAVEDIGKALETFHQFIRETPTVATFEGQQCFRCLHVTGHIVTPQHLMAILQTCNGHVATARTLILNYLTSEFRKEMAILRDAERARMHDQVVLQIISEHGPSFAADPRMIEWCTHESNHMCKGIKEKLAIEAQQACKDNYDRFLVTAQIQHDTHTLRNSKMSVKRTRLKSLGRKKPTPSNSPNSKRTQRQSCNRRSQITNLKVWPHGKPPARPNTQTLATERRHTNPLYPAPSQPPNRRTQ